MKILRWLFFPISLLYAGIMMCRNWAFDRNWFSVYKSSIPTIAVGNLNTGGTGKTPFVEYLVEKLKSDYSMATLSRGYGRKSKGFMVATKEENSLTLGDEPYQMYLKYGNQVLVSVCEKRADGLKRLEHLNKVPELVLMDDAYQHRFAARDVNILLSTYKDLFTDDYVLPTGNLREARSGANRADMIVVTKCPLDIDKQEKGQITRALAKYINPDRVFFATINYGQFKNLNHETVELPKTEIAVLTGIANALPFLDQLAAADVDVVEHFNFKDHHAYTAKDLDAISVKLSKKRVPIVTTEKDMVRLLNWLNHPLFNKTELYYLPISTELDREKDFLNLLMIELKRLKN